MSISTKREQGRERILDAARTIFAEAGLEGASLRAIAARAGYTPAALYFHFDSREAIYAALLQASLLELRADVGAAAQGGRARPSVPARWRCSISTRHGRRIWRWASISALAAPHHAAWGPRSTRS